MGLQAWPGESLTCFENRFWCVYIDAESSSSKMRGRDPADDYRRCHGAYSQIVLWEGQCIDSVGHWQHAKGAISKLPFIIGLDATQKVFIKNYHFMSSHIAGTRQIRNEIWHVICSNRMFYGMSLFLSFTISESHSALAIHLSRGRLSDPAFTGSGEIFRQWLRCNEPSLCPPP